MADMICHKVYEFLMSILNIYILGLEVGGVTTKRQGFKWNTVCTRDFTCLLVILSVFKFSWFQLGFSIDILYTLDSASNYSAIQKLKP